MGECAESTGQTIDRTIKRAVVESNVISLFERLPIYTSLRTVDLIRKSSFKYKESSHFNQTKEQCQRFNADFNSISTKASRVYHFHMLSQTIHKMKDLVSGNTLSGNGNSSIAAQKKGINNGVCNGDR